MVDLSGLVGPIILAASAFLLAQACSSFQDVAPLPATLNSRLARAQVCRGPRSRPPWINHQKNTRQAGAFLMVDLSGLEPLTSSVQTRRSTR